MGMPSLGAAPVRPEIAPSLSRNAPSMIARSGSIRFATSGALVVPDLGSTRGSHVWSIEKVSPSRRITPRSTTFCSSRMLPGQSYALSRLKVVFDWYPTDRVQAVPEPAVRIRMRLDLRGSRPSRDFRGAAAMQPVDAGRPLRGRMLWSPSSGRTVETGHDSGRSFTQ